VTTLKKFLLVLATLFLASCTPPSPSLSISPNGAVLVPREAVTLTALLLNSDLKSEIAWTITGGTLSSPTGESVTFRAEQEGTYQVTATATADPTFTRTVKITVGQEVSFGVPESPRVTEVLLESGTSKTFIIKNTNGLSKNALYFEVVSSNSLRLTLYNQNGERLATSDNPLYFSRASSSGNVLEAQAIENSSICRGPCVIVSRQNQGFVLTLENEGAGTATYDLFLYEDNVTDGLENNEPCDPTFSLSNSALSPAITIIPPDPIVRALETLNDKDCFYSEAKAGEVTLATYDSTALKVVVDVYQVRSSVDLRSVGSLSAGPGRDNDVLTFDPSYPVLIIARSGDGRAGPSGSSRYEVNYY
jgi:PKD domain